MAKTKLINVGDVAANTLGGIICSVVVLFMTWLISWAWPSIPRITLDYAQRILLSPWTLTAIVTLLVFSISYLIIARYRRHTYTHGKEMYLRTIKEYEEAAGLDVLGIIPAVRNVEGLFALEQLRRVRNLVQLHFDASQGKSLLITGLHPGDGATTICFHLATIFAATGKSVLVLDLNLRRPRLHAHFMLPNARGFINYVLQDDVSISELIYTHFRWPNLKIVTSGSLPRYTPEDEEDMNFRDDSVLPGLLGQLELTDIGFDASGILYSDAVRKLLYVLHEHFDLILIDSPPTLDFPDAEVISWMVDAEIFVVSHDPKNVENLDPYFFSAKRSAGRQLGLIVNRYQGKVLQLAYGYNPAREKYDVRARRSRQGQPEGGEAPAAASVAASTTQKSPPASAAEVTDAKKVTGSG
ncbi:MAG TPA: CpsD/CapB family tyrosine-protein kinase [Pyrinomonadaceae bacterium]|jgi:Mrp family chromosome partitioning ATPase|nr:CpsD/CapB family tyrosine-protein kinase [Pyrinomonadaceae bacterium]